MKFSIIVPVYNSSRFLHDCIASAKAQSVADWELILIDDGSTDQSADILKACAEADARLHVMHQENRGQFFARQNGISAAKGEYLIFLDSDDELMPDCLETLQTAIRKTQADMVLYTGKIICNGADSGRMIGVISENEKELSDSWLKECLISCNDLNSLCLKTFRRELFLGDDRDYSAFEGAHCGEDKVQLLHPVTKAKKITYIPNCLYRYNHRMDSVMHSVGLSQAQKMLSNEMFSMLCIYMDKWNMNDRQHLELLAKYKIQTFLSAYYGIRKSCKTQQEKMLFRQYSWSEHMPMLAQDYRLAKSRLSLRDRLKFYIAQMRL